MNTLNYQIILYFHPLLCCGSSLYPLLTLRSLEALPRASTGRDSRMSESRNQKEIKPAHQRDK